MRQGGENVRLIRDDVRPGGKDLRSTGEDRDDEVWM